MTAITAHYRSCPSEILTACGSRSVAIDFVDIPGLVTCRQCKRTLLWRKAMADVERQIEGDRRKIQIKRTGSGQGYRP